MTHLAAGLHDHVATLLDAMGEDPGAVATTLRTEEVRGVRGSALAHPVCRWLVRLVPDLGAAIGLDTVHVFRPGTGLTMQGALVPLPTAVREFADRFDDGHHPDLELRLESPVANLGPDEVYGPAAPDPAAPDPAGPAVTEPAPFPAATPMPEAAILPRDPMADTIQLPAIPAIPTQGSGVVIEGELVGHRA
jgi:hypothetical protein